MLKFLMVSLIMIIMKTNHSKLLMSLMTIFYNMSLQTWSNSKMSYVFMGDLLSFWNTNLAIWMTLILMFVNTKEHELYKMVTILGLALFLMIFHSWSLLMFYMLFEMSMIMMLIIMMTWSYQPERVEAIMFLVVMALMFSLPFMAMMMKNIKTLNFWTMNLSLTLWEYLSILGIFMMKMPFYFMHFWLPKVHVEAPVQGSMILAAIMLKLGCYGMLRFSAVLSKFKTTNLMILAMSMWSMVILSMSCFIQSDIKTLIAYSSVVHMGIVLITILINKKKSITASMTIMLSHGMCASALFFLSNIFYTISKSRSITMNKGSAQTLPMITIFWFAACMSNTPMPPAISMVGEIMSFKLILNFTNLYSIIFIMSLTSSLYSIFMFYIMIQGKSSKLTKKMFMMKIKTFVILNLHMIPLLFLSLKPKMLMII
uniref:NADH dehydrogenase subunit 4 n=1 Tax=Pealius machili TaxID=2829201 RepID=UPI001BF0C7F5|nr:NADH dehydrogenase subunit 4 [Pealius machili]QUA05861.1 NADH dehydrogenase subunit 4 [Pealius machili]